VNPKYITPDEVEALYGIPSGTLAQWRLRKVGPDYYKVGRSVKYRVEELEEFFNKGRVRCIREDS
jgi:hypothetical protein